MNRLGVKYALISKPALKKPRQSVLCLFSVRHEFPTEWAKFQAVAELALNLKEEHYPFWSIGRPETETRTVTRVELFAKPNRDTKSTITIFNKLNEDPVGTQKKDSLVKDTSLGDLRAGKLTNISLPAPIGKFTLYFNDKSMEDLWVALTWGKGA